MRNEAGEHRQALRRRGRARRRRAGFTLVEALVALLLVSLLLLAGLALQGAELRAARRRAVHAVAERVLANAYEEVRGGLVPLVVLLFGVGALGLQLYRQYMERPPSTA